MKTQSIQHKIATISSIVLLVILGGVWVEAQSYEWVTISNRSAKWMMNTLHTYTNNSGATVIGDNLPDGDLLLDVNGAVGATQYCDSLGSNCFVGTDNQWVESGNNLYVPDGIQVAIGASSTVYELEVGGPMAAGGYYNTSDQRLKTNITPIRGLETITQLEGVRFNWIDSGKPSIGLIAQDVEQVLPELVSTNPDTGIKAVEYGAVVAVLVQALREQELELEQLRQEIERELSRE